MHHGRADYIAMAEHGHRPDVNVVGVTDREKSHAYFFFNK
jgi:hypothetical protein